MTLAWDNETRGQHSHSQIISGLLHLAGYLTDNPNLPAPERVDVVWRVPGDNSERVAKVRHIATAFDRDMVWENGNRQVSTCWQFPGLTFWAVAQLLDEPDAAPPAASAEEAVTEQLPAVDPWDEPLPEVSCAGCGGKGRQRDGSTCVDCLGKGRIAAWVPQAVPAW
jgi:hypothetical protein